LEAALKDIRSLCDPAPDLPEIDWDGASPIDGEEVTRHAHFTGRDYVFTATRVYLVRAKNNGKP